MVHPVSARQNHAHKPQIQQNIHRRIGDRSGHRRPALPLHHLLIDPVKPLPLIILFRQGFNHPDPHDILPQHLHKLVYTGLRLGKKRDALSRHQYHHRCQQRQGRQQYAGKHRVQQHGHNDAAGQQNRRAHPQSLDSGQHLVQIIGVCGQTRHQRRAGKTVDLAIGQIQNLGKKVIADHVHGITGHPGCHPVGQDIEGDCQHRTKEHKYAPHKNLPLPVRRNHHIDHMGQRPGQQKIHHRPRKFNKKSKCHSWVKGGYVHIQNLFHNGYPFSAFCTIANDKIIYRLL